MKRTSGSRVRDDASAEGGSYECSTPPRPVDRLAAVSSLVGSTIRDVEMDLIRETLRVHGGKRIVAAGLLGVSVRMLRNKVGRRSESHSQVRTQASGDTACGGATLTCRSTSPPNRNR